MVSGERRAARDERRAPRTVLGPNFFLPHRVSLTPNFSILFEGLPPNRPAEVSQSTTLKA